MHSFDIRVVKPQREVRACASLYIGETNNGAGLHNMAFWIIDRAIEEARTGGERNIFITVHEDNSVEVRHYGHIVVDSFLQEEGTLAVEATLTQLCAGVKRPLFVVNALSQKLDLEIHYAGRAYRQSYENGEPKTALMLSACGEKTGAMIRFWPAREIFTHVVDFDFTTLATRLRETARLNPDVALFLQDWRVGKEAHFCGISNNAPPLAKSLSH